MLALIQEDQYFLVQPFVLEKSLYRRDDGEPVWIAYWGDVFEENIFNIFNIFCYVLGNLLRDMAVQFRYLRRHMSISGKTSRRSALSKISPTFKISRALHPFSRLQGSPAIPLAVLLRKGGRFIFRQRIAHGKINLPPLWSRCRVELIVRGGILNCSQEFLP